jgi:hypothetical protein
MKKNILMNTIIMSLLIVFSFSCKKDEPVGGTGVQNLSGDWHVRVNDAGAYSSLYTFNTADNTTTQMWVQATGLRSGTVNIGVKGKVDVNVADQTFSGANIANIGTNKTTLPTFSIANGKVTTNGTVGPVSKTPADAITFDLIINGVTYKVSGYHKTGFMEDLPQ